jgi:hypothetical protein
MRRAGTAGLDVTLTLVEILATSVATVSARARSRTRARCACLEQGVGAARRAPRAGSGG